MYICSDCGHLTSDVGSSLEYRGECFGSPSFEDVGETCSCGGEYEEANECGNCGNYYTHGELCNGYCPTCVEESKTFDNAVDFGKTFCDSDNIAINQLLAEYFSADEIEKILFEEIRKEKTFFPKKTVDAINALVNVDDYMFVEKIKRSDRGGNANV